MSNQTTTPMLKFSKGNAKLPKTTLIFSLPAGHTCPGAKDCKSFVTINEDGKRRLEDGPDNQFRCYAATSEAVYPAVFEARKHNHDLLLPISRNVDAMVKFILESMHAKGMDKITKVRVHESGDYFTLSYFKAWMKVAAVFPNIKFYSYTKSLPFIVKGKKEGIIPSNFYFTASKGGQFDYLIAESGFKSVTVTTTETETLAAETLGGKFDHDDELALGSEDFFLQVHGQQPAGTESAKYWDTLVREKRGGYSKRTKKIRADKTAKNAAKAA